MHLDGLIAPRYPRCQSYTEHAYIDYAKKGKEMRKAFIGTVVVMIALFVFSSLAFAQTAPSQNQANQARSPWKYYPKDVAVGDGGPAPKRDLSGTWAGPGSTPAIPAGTPAERPGGRVLAQRQQPIANTAINASNGFFIRVSFLLRVSPAA
jgi:hypothetical protein